MTLRFAVLALALAAPSAAWSEEPAPEITLEQRMLLRCSAAFALVADRQARGDPAALDYPPMAARGKEFFVRSAAEVMDEAGLDRAQVDAALSREAREIVDSGTLAKLMPVCLGALEQSGL